MPIASPSGNISIESPPSFSDGQKHVSVYCKTSKTFRPKAMLLNSFTCIGLPGLGSGPRLHSCPTSSLAAKGAKLEKASELRSNCGRSKGGDLPIRRCSWQISITLCRQNRQLLRTIIWKKKQSGETGP